MAMDMFSQLEDVKGEARDSKYKEAVGLLNFT